MTKLFLAHVSKEDWEYIKRGAILWKDIDDDDGESYHVEQDMNAEPAPYFTIFTEEDDA